MRQAFLLLLVTACASAWAQSSSPASLQKDRALFQMKCASCHSVACNRLGPKLEGIPGRKAGSQPDYKGYSDSLRASAIVWDEKTLDAFLRDGARLVPGNSMSGVVAPVTDARERRSLIEHMRRQDRSIDLC